MLKLVHGKTNCAFENGQVHVTHQTLTVTSNMNMLGLLSPGDIIVIDGIMNSPVDVSQITSESNDWQYIGQVHVTHQTLTVTSNMNMLGLLSPGDIIVIDLLFTATVKDSMVQ